MFSQMRQEADAAQRRVMTMTFLSLLQKESVSDNEKAIILAALFQGNEVGAIQDDGAPTSSYELIARMLGGSR